MTWDDSSRSEQEDAHASGSPLQRLFLRQIQYGSGWRRKPTRKGFSDWLTPSVSNAQEWRCLIDFPRRFSKVFYAKLIQILKKKNLGSEPVERQISHQSTQLNNLFWVSFVTYTSWPRESISGSSSPAGWLGFFFIFLWRHGHIPTRQCQDLQHKHHFPAFIGLAAAESRPYTHLWASLACAGGPTLPQLISLKRERRWTETDAWTFQKSVVQWKEVEVAVCPRSSPETSQMIEMFQI